MSPDITGYHQERKGNPQIHLYHRKRVTIPLGILILILIFGFVYWYTNLRNYVSTNDAYVAANNVSISPEFTARIKRLTVKEADTVQKGQVLVYLDDVELRAVEELARANINVNQNSVALATVNSERAHDDFLRAEYEFKKAAITREQYGHAQKALEAARAELNIAQSKRNIAESQLGVAETQLKNTIITAPFNGVVGKRTFREGEVVLSGEPIFVIYDLNNVGIKANLEETKLSKVKLQDRVEITVDAYPGKLISGKVVMIGASTASKFTSIPSNNASAGFVKISQRVPVDISFENMTTEDRKKFPLRPGMSVEVRIRIR
jgi:membrane fusion protein, multidrug efflux system